MNNGLRVVKVHLTDGTNYTTNMAAHISDDEIKKYFRKGLELNMGNGAHDLMKTVDFVEILENKNHIITTIKEFSEYKSQSNILRDIAK